MEGVQLNERKELVVVLTWGYCQFRNGLAGDGNNSFVWRNCCQRL